MSKNKHKEEKNKKEEIFPKEEDVDIKDSGNEADVQDEDASSGKCNCSCDNDEKISALEETNESLTKEINNLKEALLRNQAELQNYKRRKDEESAKFQKYKNEELITELLPIVDNFERAIKMDDNDLSDEVSKFLAGFKLIYTNTINILNKFEVKEIDAEGVEFDPNYHHAVLTEHDENKPAGVVLEVLQKGYTYKDRVIRASMVKVNE